MASDLRLIVSVLRVTAELERIGDLAPARREARTRPRRCSTASAADASTSSRSWPTTPSSATATPCGPGAPTISTWPAPSPAGSRVTDLHMEQLTETLLALGGPDAARIALRSLVAGQALDRIADHAAILGRGSGT